MNTLLLSIAPLSVLLVAGAARGQPVTVQARALSNLSASAQVGGQQNAAVLPAGSALQDGTSVRASVSGTSPLGIAVANTLVRIREEPNRIEYSISELALAAQPPLPSTAGSTGGHETLLSIRLAAGIRAKLQLEWSASSSGQASLLPAEVDVFNDGVVDFLGAVSGASSELPGWVGPRTIDIRTRTGASATAQNGLALARSSLVVRVLPDTPGSVDRILPGCGGALTLEPTFDGDVDAVYSLPPGSAGILVGGFAAAPVAGPPLPCPFLPRPDAIAVLDPTRSRLRLGLTAIRPPFGALYFQGLSFAFGQLRATASWAVTSSR